MQQKSGFEDRLIDVYNCSGGDFLEHKSEISSYAALFKSNDSTSIVVFPGMKNAAFSSAHSEENAMPIANITLPIALLVAVLLFTALKNALKTSIGSLLLLGISPKFLQETERRQIERNRLIINIINILSFFLIAIVLYAFMVRSDFLSDFFKLPNLSENVFNTTIFFSIVGIVFIFFSVRSGFISFFGDVFSAPKMMKEYQKSYKFLFISISPILLFMAVFIAFAPYFLTSLMSGYIIFCISVFYAGFVVLSLFKFANFTNRYTIHIFLYLCTLEILPLLVVVKFLKGVCF